VTAVIEAEGERVVCPAGFSSFNMRFFLPEIARGAGAGWGWWHRLPRAPLLHPPLECDA